MKLDIEPLKETSDDDGSAEDTEDDSISIDGPPKATPVMKCEVREYEERHNLKGEKIMKLLEDKAEGNEKDEGKDYAMISYKHYGPDGSLHSSRLEIHSPEIKKALREVIKKYPGVSFSGETIILHGQLKCIFHYRDELEKYRQNSTEKAAKWHVHLILRFMGKELQRSVRSYKAHVETVPSNPSIEFGDLWMAFVPGELMITGQGEARQILRLQSTIFMKDPNCGQLWYASLILVGGLSTQPQSFILWETRLNRMNNNNLNRSITGRCFTHDGIHFGYSDKIVEIYNFGGALEVSPSFIQFSGFPHASSVAYWHSMDSTLEFGSRRSIIAIKTLSWSSRNASRFCFSSDVKNILTRRSFSSENYPSIHCSIMATKKPFAVFKRNSSFEEESFVRWRGSTTELTVAWHKP
jgi:hypothetical protein